MASTKTANGLVISQLILERANAARWLKSLGVRNAPRRSFVAVELREAHGYRAVTLRR